MKVLKSFEKTKEVSYFGLEFQVPLETTHLAIESYADSDNAMVIAFSGKASGRSMPSGTFFWLGNRLCVIAIVNPEGVLDEDSLRAVTGEQDGGSDQPFIRPTLVG